MLESDEESYFSEEESVIDSDVELQEAFARGELKPGLVVRQGKPAEKPPVINDVARMKSVLNQLKLPSTLNWVERLDVVNDLAALAPEIAIQLDEHREKREKEIKVANARKVKKKKGSAVPLQAKLKSIDEDPIHNDFKREMTFHRQAQQAIMICLPRLKALGVPTKRPDDYFAEMAKSDNHMQKVASVLLKKQTVSEKAEKVRKMREQKKFAKQTQVHVLQERQKAKKEMIESVKKYRKGQKNNLDFLEEKKSARTSRNEPSVSRKREMKNDKYGYGGKKKGSNWNTLESLDEMPESRGRGFRGGGRGRGGSRDRDTGGDRGGFSRGGGRGGRGRGGSRDRDTGGDRGGFSRGGSRGAMGRGGERGGFSRGGSRGAMGRGGERGGFSRGSRGAMGRGGERGGFSRGGSRGGMERGGDRGGFSRGGGRGGMGRGGERGGMSRGGGSRGGMGRGGGRGRGGSRGKVNRPGKDARMKAKQ